MGIKAVKDFLVGALVGIMSMMPGASGGIIAVIFGVYERLISDLANIREKLLKDLRFIIPLGLGIVVGLVVCAVGIDALLQDWEVAMMFFFAALILCQLPDIYKLSNDDSDERPTNWNLLVCAAGAVVMIAFLFVGSSDSGISLVEMDAVDVVLLFVIGVVVALSKIVPGLSGAAILLAIGLYTPLMDLIGDMDMSIIMERITALIPILVGLVVGVLGLSKIVDWFMRNHRRSTYFCILGMTAGSVVTVAVQATQGMADVDAGVMIPASVVGIVMGLALGYVLSRVSRKYAEDTVSETPADI